MGILFAFPPFDTHRVQGEYCDNVYLAATHEQIGSELGGTTAYHVFPLPDGF